jgi:hypothetical protein
MSHTGDEKTPNEAKNGEDGQNNPAILGRREFKRSRKILEIAERSQK